MSYTTVGGRHLYDVPKPVVTAATLKRNETEQMAECTFKPEISAFAKNIQSDSVPVSERSNDILREREKRLQKLREQLEDKTLKLTFKPEISKFNFKETREPFMKTVDEQIQKKREFQEFMEQKKRDIEEKQTPFVPNISTYSKNLDRGDEPVHERLFRLSTSLSTSMDSSQLENNAELTFTPRLLAQPIRPRQGKIEERLYQEHMERETKQQKVKQMQEDEIKKMRDVKLSDRSKPYLRSKLEKKVEEAWAAHETKQGVITYAELGPILFKMGLFKSTRQSEDEVRVCETIWKLLDPEDVGFVNFEAFKDLIVPVLEDDQNNPIEKPELRELQYQIKQLNINKLVYSYVHQNEKKQLIQQEFDKELTFHPRIIENPEYNHSYGVINSPEAKEPRYEMLLTKRLETEEKLKIEREKSSKKEIEECTFTPKINTNAKTLKRRSDANHFEHLYKQSQEKQNKAVTPTSLDKEVEKFCTFSPATLSYKPIQPAGPKGFKETIDRMRKAQEEKQALKKIQDTMGTLKEPNADYKNKKTEFKQFNFQLEKRIRVKPLLFMDVNLGPGRTGRIGIHEGDDPKVLAKNFAASYKLDDVLSKRLEELIRDNMKNKIAQQAPSKPVLRSKTPDSKRSAPNTTSTSNKTNDRRSSSAKRPQRNKYAKSPPKESNSPTRDEPDYQAPNHRSEISTQTLSLSKYSPSSTHSVLNSLRELKSFTADHEL